MTGLDLMKEAAMLAAMMDAPEGADPDVLNAELAEWLESVDDKLTAYWAVCKRLDAEAAQVRELEQTLARRRRYLDAQMERVRTLAGLLLMSREEVGEASKVKTPLFTAWLAETSSVAIHADVSELPAEYHRVSVEPDKAALKRDIEAGAVISGVELQKRRAVRWR